MSASGVVFLGNQVDVENEERESIEEVGRVEDLVAMKKEMWSKGLTCRLCQLEYTFGQTTS